MKRRDLLINLLLLVVIGTLAYYIYEGGDSEAPTGRMVAMASRSETSRPETSYDAKAGEQKYPNLGKVPIYQALLTPTPTQPPPTAKPTVTPNIHTALASWKLQMVDPDTGEAMIEDKANKNPAAENVFTMKLNDTRVVTFDNISRTVTMIKEDKDSDNPSATFKMDGAEGVEHTLRMIEDSPAPSESAPPGSPVAPTPQPPPGS